MLIENALEIGKNIYLCFIDYEKAFDEVRHVELMRILKNIGIDGKDLRLIETLCRKQRVALRIENKLKEWTKIKRGVRQGCCMSPDFFNLYAEAIIREIKEEDGIKIGGEQYYQYKICRRYCLDSRLRGKATKLIAKS